VQALVADLKASTATGLRLADDADDEAGENEEMERIANLEGMLQEYGGLIDETFGLLDTQEPEAATDYFLQRHGPIIAPPPGAEKGRLRQPGPGRHQGFQMLPASRWTRS